MSEPTVGQKAPAFSLPGSDGKTHSLADFASKKLVLYFYPKDDTSGCTQQACDFRDSLARARSAGAVVVGVSPDPLKAHAKFKEKHDLPFLLLSDESKKMLERYGVWVEKSMYGRKYMGVERSTFLIDAKGVIRQAWRKVKVPGHVDEVIAATNSL